MKILISGCGGFIGSRLAARLSGEGHEVWKLARIRREQGAQNGREVFWDPALGQLDLEAWRRAGSFDAVIHLAGEAIANKRWTPAQKQIIFASREQSTRLLCQTLLSSPCPPKTVLGASAIGFYGNRGEETLDETSAPSEEFLGKVCQAWEAALAPLATQGVRVANLRFGVVLSPEAGALAKMLPAFKMGLGGRLGGGKQWMSWIALEDALEAILFILNDPTLVGPVNLVSPHPVRNSEFTAALAQVLRRSALIPAPVWALRLLFGEMADALLLTSQRVLPAALTAQRFEFRRPELKDAFRDLTG